MRRGQRIEAVITIGALLLVLLFLNLRNAA